MATVAIAQLWRIPAATGRAAIDFESISLLAPSELLAEQTIFSSLCISGRHINLSADAFIADPGDLLVIFLHYLEDCNGGGEMHGTVVKSQVVYECTTQLSNDDYYTSG